MHTALYTGKPLRIVRSRLQILPMASMLMWVLYHSQSSWLSSSFRPLHCSDHGQSSQRPCTSKYTSD